LCRTNIPGLYAGDVSSVPEKQIIIAAGEGAKAALNAWEYLMATRNDFRSPVTCRSEYFKFIANNHIVFFVGKLSRQ
jgi:hypothetical protein